MTAPGTPYPDAPYAGSTQVGTGSPGVDVSQMSVGQLVGQVTNDLSTLVRQEIALAKAELKIEAAKAGKSAGMLGAAGYVGHLTAIFASLTIVFVLDTFLPLWAAALVVTVLYGVVAAVLATRGRAKLKTVDPVPHQTVETLKEDAQWARRSS